MYDPHRDTDVPDTATLRVAAVDGIVERFTAAWACGDEPHVADFVGASLTAADTELAADLVRIDMHERASRGQAVCLDSYLADLPELKETPVEIIALILDEYSIRTDAGQPVTYEEYARRFPEHLDTLRRELDLTAEATGEFDAAIDGEHEAEPCREHPAAGHAESLNADNSRESAWFNDIPDTLDGPASPDDGLQTRSESTHIGPLTATGSLRPGTRLGDFQIERLVGQGGLARVYKARQLSLDRVVALKVTPEPDEKHASGDEGRNMAALVHDHIVPVFSQEHTGGFEILAMGYVPGPTLSGLLDVFAQIGRRNLSGHRCVELLQNQCDDNASAHSQDSPAARHRNFLQFSCALMRDLGRALGHAHDKGILHCDVKPANILFAPSGRAMLTDFNVSTRNDRESDTAIGGTLQYMSPEQLAAVTGAGPADAIDERSDVYSLGLVLFELVTGARPFSHAIISGNPLTAAGELLAARLSGNPDFPETKVRLPAAVQSIICKSLAPSPAQRYQTADELVEDLDRWLSSQRLKHAPDTDRIDRTRRWMTRHRAASVFLASVAVLGLILTTRSQEPPIVVDIDAPPADVPTREENRVALELDRRARVLLVEQKPSEALPLLERAAELSPTLAAIQHNLGVARFRSGQYAAALNSFDRAIENGRETGLTYSHRAAARFATEDIDGARTDIERSLELASPTERAEVEANAQEFESLLRQREKSMADRNSS